MDFNFENNKEVFFELRNQLKKDKSDLKVGLVKYRLKLDAYFKFVFRSKKVGNIVFSKNDKYFAHANFLNELKVYKNVREKEVAKKI